jgi:hypothetical protein
MDFRFTRKHVAPSDSFALPNLLHLACGDVYTQCVFGKRIAATAFSTWVVCSTGSRIAVATWFWIFQGTPFRKVHDHRDGRDRDWNLVQNTRVWPTSRFGIGLLSRRQWSITRRKARFRGAFTRFCRSCLKGGAFFFALPSDLYDTGDVEAAPDPQPKEV